MHQDRSPRGTKGMRPSHGPRSGAGDGSSSTRSPVLGTRREGSPRGVRYFRGGLRRGNGGAVGCGLRVPAGNPAAGV